MNPTSPQLASTTLQLLTKANVNFVDAPACIQVQNWLAAIVNGQLVVSFPIKTSAGQTAQSAGQTAGQEPPQE